MGTDPAIIKEKKEDKRSTKHLNKAKEILAIVKAGKRKSQIIAQYPVMARTVEQLMWLWPIRDHTPQLLYLWGQTGIGKTTAINTVLKTIRHHYNIDYYFKPGGLSKYFDGYNNEPIVVNDDPIPPNIKVDGDDIQMLKRVISTGDTIVEVKYGSVVFDTYLLIITANTDPRQLAERCGLECREAIFRRFIDTCGAHEITSSNRDYMYWNLIMTVKTVLEF